MSAFRAPFSLLRRLPLRVTLVLALLGLAALGLSATGVVVTTQLRQYLVAQVDADLVQLAERQPRSADIGGPGVEDDGPFATSRDEYFAVAARDGTRLQGETTYGARPPVLSADQLRFAAFEPFTVPAAEGGSDWRVLVRSDLVLAQTGEPVLVVRGVSLADVDATTRRLVLVEVLVGAGVLTLLGLLAYVVVQESLRPLREVEDTAGAISAGDLSRRVPASDPRTEVGRLSHAFNAMVGQIEQAFRARESSEQRLRRFVSDASHELRTPLTSIRGFAELHRQGAVTELDEVARLLRRIEDEANRMSALVDDLLTLARLDEERAVQASLVDLAILAADAVHDARAIQPARRIALRLADGPVVVWADESRLRQVLANLVGNAVQHTPIEAAVEVRVRSSERSAIVEVSDQGPGLAPEEAERVFERFYRADASRTRASGGSGLGLSIVDSLVSAHGGAVELDTSPGHGSTFRVVLPLAPRESQGS